MNLTLSLSLSLSLSLGGTGSSRAVGFSHQGPNYRQNNDFLKSTVQLLEWHRFLFFLLFKKKLKEWGDGCSAHLSLSFTLLHRYSTQRLHNTFFSFCKNNRLFSTSHTPLSLSLWRPVLMLLDHNAVFQPVCQLNQSSIPLPYTGALLTSRHCCHLFLSLLIFLVLKQGQIRDSVIFSFWSRPLPCFASPYTHTLRPPSQSSLDSPSSQVH